MSSCHRHLPPAWGGLGVVTRVTLDTLAPVAVVNGCTYNARMRAQSPHARRKHRIVWHVFCGLALLSFLYRALIPVGYMPDASGERNGFFAVTLCSPGGASTLLMNLGGPDDPTSPGDHAGAADCPFALVVSQAVFPGAELSIQPGLVAQRTVPVSLRNQALPPLPALGPPLGSRAPPLNLG